ncbi:MAG: PEP-CTERM sorting domain-containing protein [Planctomycetota bacterium]
MFKSLALSTLSLAAAAVLTAGVSAQTLATNFTGLPVGGQPVAYGTDLDTILTFTQFGGPNTGTTTEAFDGTPNLGEVLFIQNGAFYVPGSNRGYGFFGPGRSDITFTPGFVSAVTLQVRGSEGGESANVGPLDTSDVSVLIWSELGVQATFAIGNDAFEEVALDVSALGFLGESITRISLINADGVGSNAIGDIGLLSVTVIPEPSSAGLIALGLPVLLKRRRRTT